MSSQTPKRHPQPHFSLQGLWRTISDKVIHSRFVQNVGVLMTANFVGVALSFAQGILVARWLGPELYGIAALVMIYPALVYSLFNTRSNEISIKYLSEFHARGERDSVLAMCKLGYAVDFGTAVLTFLVVLCTASWAAIYVAHRPETVGLIAIYAAAFLPHRLVGTSYAVLATVGSFRTIAVLVVLTDLLRVGLVVGMVVAGWGISGVVWGNAIATAASGLLYGFMAFAQMKRTWGASWLQGDWGFLKERRSEIFSSLAYNYLNTLLGMIPEQLDVILLGYFRNPLEVGYYRLAKTLGNTVGYLVTPLQSVSYPELARLWGLGAQQAIRQKMRKFALRIGVPLGLAVLLTIPLVPFILPTLFGQAYRPAVLASQILLIASAIRITFFWLRPVYMAQGRIRHWILMSTAGVTLSVLAYPAMIWRWGYIGLSIWGPVRNLFHHSLAFWFLGGKVSRKKMWQPIDQKKF